MGLDMFLERTNKDVSEYIDKYIPDIKKNSPEIYEKLRPYILPVCDDDQWESITEEVGYWREARHIHDWFVKNIQDGVDSCKYFRPILKEELKTLREICIKVHSSRDNASYSYEKELLPMRSSSFFSEEEYTSYYYFATALTVQIIDKVLETTNFETHDIWYSSSW